MERNLFAILTKIHSLVLGMQTAVAAYLKLETIKKNIVILNSEQVDRHIYITAYGLLWAYYLLDGDRCFSLD